ncbi:MAG: hypothetical protein H0X51_05195 [Parachlamydiaceae bacterium]|nr:hypothetical protein [Parachlamydiaceae bacterium]
MKTKEQIYNTDARLIAAYQQIEAGTVTTLSIDVFDTLLWRKVPRPVDLFLLLGQQLKREGWLIEAISADCFAALRQQAEQVARLKKTEMYKVNQEKMSILPEVTLKEVYWTCSGLFNKVSIDEMVQGKKGIINESDVDDLVALEVDWEIRMTELDLNIVRLIHFAHQHQVSVMLISDTYLEHVHLSKILNCIDPFSGNPLFSFIHKLFVSCEYGCGKQTGLFKIVLEEFGILPESLLHIGDNYHSDYTSAQELGIQTIYYSKMTPDLVKTLSFEWSEHNLRERLKCLDPNEGDFGLTSLRCKIAHHIDCLELKEEEAFYWRYGASILAPVLVGFVQWIYQRCQHLKESRVFCLMREGQLYAHLIREYAPYYPEWQIEAQELWVSRQFMIPACIRQAHVHEIMMLAFFTPATPQTLAEFCHTLGLDITKIDHFKEYQHVKMDQLHFCEEVAHYLSGTPELRDEIIWQSAQKRKRFIKHLSSLVDLSQLKQMTVVDVGWGGTIQGSIQMILYLEGYSIKVHGLYIGTDDRASYPMLQGFVREGYLFNAGQPEDIAKIIQRGFHVLEQSATADLLPLVDFDKEGKVVHGESIIGKEQQRQVVLVRRGMKAMCHLIGQTVAREAIKWNSISQQLIEQLRQILLRSTGHPTHKEAVKFGHWSHDHRVGAHAHVLAKDKYYNKFIADIPPEMAFRDSAIAWPAAYIAKKDENYALAAQFVRRNLLEKESFLSHDTVPFKVFLDTGSGFHKKATRALSLRSNANRRFYALTKLRSFIHPMRNVRLELSPHVASLIRIKSLRFNCHLRSTASTHMLAFFESNEEPDIGWEATKVVGGGMFFCEENQPLIIDYRFDDPGVYLIQLSVCFELLAIEEANRSFLNL